jgi:CubicO group peptidase (beta-lactamase class C family)
MRTAALTLAILLPLAHAAAQTLPDTEIRKILADRIDAQKQGVGIVVGVIDAQGRRIVSYGSLDPGDKRPLNGDTVFEIGSMTKVFTSLVMMDMARRGEIAITDPIAKYLPADVKVPERNGRQITFEDLSTQSSGLPRMPSNMSPKDAANPYADYTVAQLYQFLSGYQLTRDIGSQYEYSNLGGGLLGHVLALRAGMDYESLVKSRIAKPLAMNSTAITLTPELKARLAPGHNGNLKVVPNWDLPTLAGAGALRSTANDILTFLAANLGYVDSPLAPSMAAMVKVHKPTGTGGLDIAYAWHMFLRTGDSIIWHNGGTGGYQTFMGYDPKARLGVVVLSNASTKMGIDDIARHLLDATFPLSEPPKPHTEIQADPKTFDAFVGRYELAPNFILSISRGGDNLYAQATGQGRFPIFPEAERQFFAKVADIQIVFAEDSLTLRQNGAETHAKRISRDVPAVPVHKEIALDPKVFDNYVGRYQLAPSFVLTVTREGNRYFVQGTGQEKGEIFAESDHEFFARIVDAQFTFKTDDKGRATEVVLHQGGADMPAKRIE